MNPGFMHRNNNADSFIFSHLTWPVYSYFHILIKTEAEKWAHTKTDISILQAINNIVQLHAKEANVGEEVQFLHILNLALDGG
jgi:hypothetical protein